MSALLEAAARGAAKRSLATPQMAPLAVKCWACGHATSLYMAWRGNPRCETCFAPLAVRETAEKPRDLEAR